LVDCGSPWDRQRWDEHMMGVYHNQGDRLGGRSGGKGWSQMLNVNLIRIFPLLLPYSCHTGTLPLLPRTRP
jgi:hypothetical protein